MTRMSLADTPFTRLFSAATLCLALIAAPGCGDDTGGPTPQKDLGNPFPDQTVNPCASCSGCCLNNQCMPGTSISACGFGGLTCNVCQPTDQCVNGTCVPQQPTCGPSNCADGCCSAQGCVKPPSEANCGIGGAACKQCTGDDVCTAAGTCDKPAPKTYAVTINGCEITKSCDTVGKCDAYAEVALGSGAVVKTPEIASATPAWDFKLFDATDKELTTSKLAVRILDNDIIGADEMGKCDVTVTAADLKAGSLTTTCGEHVDKLKFSFAVVP